MPAGPQYRCALVTDEKLTIAIALAQGILAKGVETVGGISSWISSWISWIGWISWILAAC